MGRKWNEEPYEVMLAMTLESLFVSFSISRVMYAALWLLDRFTLFNLKNKYVLSFLLSPWLKILSYSQQTWSLENCNGEAQCCIFDKTRKRKCFIFNWIADKVMWCWLLKLSIFWVQAKGSRDQVPHSNSFEASCLSHGIHRYIFFSWFELMLF